MGLLPRSFYLDDLFDDFDRHPAPRHHEMKCDISEDKDNYLIEMDIPGYNKEDIKIECENGLLTVSAEKKQEVNENDPDKKYIRRERVYGSVSRSFNFSDINDDGIKAEFNNGTLNVIIPKIKKEDSKKIIEIN